MQASHQQQPTFMVCFFFFFEKEVLSSSQTDEAKCGFTPDSLAHWNSTTKGQLLNILSEWVDQKSVSWIKQNVTGFHH